MCCFPQESVNEHRWVVKQWCLLSHVRGCCGGWSSSASARRTCTLGFHSRSAASWRGGAPRGSRRRQPGKRVRGKVSEKKHQPWKRAHGEAQMAKDTHSFLLSLLHLGIWSRTQCPPVTQMLHLATRWRFKPWSVHWLFPQLNSNRIHLVWKIYFFPLLCWLNKKQENHGGRLLSLKVWW